MYRRALVLSSLTFSLFIIQHFTPAAPRCRSAKTIINRRKMSVDIQVRIIWEKLVFNTVVLFSFRLPVSIFTWRLSDPTGQGTDSSYPATCYTTQVKCFRIFTRVSLTMYSGPPRKNPEIRGRAGIYFPNSFWTPRVCVCLNVCCLCLLYDPHCWSARQ